MRTRNRRRVAQVMALVAMEQPARLDADSFRAVRVEALRAVATPVAQRMRATTVRARYTAWRAALAWLLSDLSRRGALSDIALVGGLPVAEPWVIAAPAMARVA